MKHAGLGAAAAGLTFLATQTAYRDAFAVVIPWLDIELPTEVARALLMLAAFFIPSVIAVWSPGLAGIVKDLLDKLLPNLSPDPEPLTDMLPGVAAIATELAMRGDADGVKCCNHLHEHLLSVTTTEHCKPEA